MIHCKPKTSTYFSLGIVVLVLVTGLGYLFYDFSSNRSFGLTFYLISCSLLTLILIILLIKMIAGYRFLLVTKGKVTVRLPFRGMKKTYRLEHILVWQEEIIKANKKDFKQLTLVFEDKSSFALSNHEHTDYDALYRYLAKKIPKKRVK